MRLSMRPRAQRGVTLIEVIITMAIISIAATGIFGVQSGSMRSSNEVRLRSAAIEITEDMLAHLRSNRFELASYAGSSTAPPSSPNRVRYDYSHLNGRLAAYFQYRSPVFTIAVDGNNFVTLNLRWNAGLDGNGAPRVSSYTITAQM